MGWACRHLHGPATPALPPPLPPAASGVSGKVPTLACQLWEDGTRLGCFHGGVLSTGRTEGARGLLAEQRPCRVLPPITPLSPGRPLWAARPVQVPLTSHTAGPVLAVQSSTNVPWELVRDAEPWAPLPPTEPEPAFAQDAQVAPRSAEPRGCNKTWASNAAEDVAASPRSELTPSQATSGENVLRGVCTHLFKQHQT